MTFWTLDVPFGTVLISLHTVETYPSYNIKMSFGDRTTPNIWTMQILKACFGPFLFCVLWKWIVNISFLSIRVILVLVKCIVDAYPAAVSRSISNIDIVRMYIHQLCLSLFIKHTMIKIKAKISLGKTNHLKTTIHHCLASHVLFACLLSF